MRTAEPPVDGFAGLTATEILGAAGGRAASLRLVEPLAHGLTWIGTFVGIVAGSFVLTDLVPSGFEQQLVLLALFALAAGILSVLSARFAPEHVRYSLFRLSSIAALALFATVYVLGREAIPVILVISIGFPLQVSHFLTRRDLLGFMSIWTVIATAAVVFGVTGPLTVEQVVPIYLAVVPLTWIVCEICFQLSEARFAAIDDAGLKALRDSQTGLANRRGLTEVGSAMLETGRVAGLVMIDLDDFKSANTLYGHAGGDRVIAEVSRELLERCGDQDLAVRLGGDEFVVVISRIRGKSLADEQRAYEHAVASLSNRLAMPGFELSASTGAARIGVDGGSIDELLIAAEAGLTEAKADKPVRIVPKAVRMPHELRSPEVPAEDLRAALRPEMPVPEFGVMRRSTGVLAAALVLLASLPFLGSSIAECAAIAAISAAMLAGVAINRRTAFALDDSLVTLGGYAAYPLIALIALFTGGADGPALPLLFGLIAYDARDNSLGQMAAKLCLAELVAFSPLLYAAGQTAFEWQTTLGVIAAVTVMLPIVVGLLMRFRTQIEAARQRASELARRDQLTGVLNRRAFEEAAAAAIASGERCAIVMIDLDNFKAVNTQDGYAGGDAVLAAIGRQLTDATRDFDVVGRVGGDEFAALLREVGSIDLGEAAGRFMSAVDFAVRGRGSAAARSVSASCGIAVHPDHGHDFATLMLAADSALMSVKHSGKSAALMQPTAGRNS